MTMTTEDKMGIMEKAVAYARPGTHNCLDCIGPGGCNKTTGQLNCRSANSSEIAGLIAAIKEIGLTPEVVDEAVLNVGGVEGGRPLGLSRNRIGGCIDVDRFLEIVKSLL